MLIVDLAGSRCSSRLSRQTWRRGIVGCCPFFPSFFVLPEADWNNRLHSQHAGN